MKHFNTEGPIIPEDHYYIPVARRIDLDEINTLIERKKYFVLHAPWQSGKTTALLEIMRQLKASGQYRCLYINAESTPTARENIADAMATLVSELVEAERDRSPQQNFFADHQAAALAQDPNSAFKILLSAWTRQSSLPTVLLIDEIDALIGDTLVSVLHQLRAGYASRPNNFPQSVIHCGVRDVRDYRIHASSEKEPVTGGSCFNAKAKSLTVGNFSADEVKELYLQHTKDTGQIFTPEAITLAYHHTRGQPWLVNALAYEASFEIKAGKNRQNPIIPDLMREAKENLIKRRVTHLDQLADKLKEPRVRSIIAPLMQGEEMGDTVQDHIDYCIDLGLIIRSPNGLEISNPIYREVIPRELTNKGARPPSPRASPKSAATSTASVNSTVIS